ncbi:MAG: hypothetical protein IT457_06725 [Planctomycetes bacterium]|nr:hypothetical protein [Planctomycetota bacterium]
MWLAFRRMPWPLRALVWLYAVHGVVRVVGWVISRLGEGVDPLSRLLYGIAVLVAAVQLFRGRRDGLDLLLLHNALVLAAAALGIWREGGFHDVRTASAVAGLVVLTAYLAWCRVRLRWRERGSYGHWMSDPTVRQDAAAWFAERDRIVERDLREAPDPDEVVRELLAGADLELVRFRIQARPEHYEAALRRAVVDPAFDEREKALAMLIDRLPERALAELAPKLVARVQLVPPEARGHLKARLAATGDASLAPWMVTELAGEHGSQLARGLAEALRQGRVGDDLRRVVEPALRAQVASGAAAGAAYEALARLDPELPRRLLAAAASLEEQPLRGLVALVDAKIPLPAETLQLWRRLRDLRQWFWCWRLMEHLTVPDDELRDLLTRAEAGFGDAPSVHGDYRGDGPRYARLCHTRALEQLLARSGREVEALLERAIERSLEVVSDTAATLLLRMHGLPEDWKFGRREDLTEKQRWLRCLSLSDSLACNGGLEHVVDCLDDEEMVLFESALAAIAPPEPREVWREALLLMLGERATSDRRERQTVLMARYDAVEHRLRELSEAYYRCRWQLDVAMVRFAILHRRELYGG